MKKLFVAVAALATMLFMSCTKEQTTDAKLQGTWKVKSANIELYEDGKKIETPAAVKEFLEDLEIEEKMANMSEGATLTFANGKATSTYTHEGKTISDVADYTINGSALTIKPKDGETLNFTIKELTASNLVLTLSVVESAELDKLINDKKSHSVLFVITCTK